MDRQNLIVTALVVVVLVVAGALVFWPDSTERATVATGQSAAGDSAASSEDRDT